MSIVQILIYGLLAALLPTTSAQNPYCTNIIYRVQAIDLREYGPAETYCAASYPVQLAQVTSTRTARTSTLSTTVSTVSPLTTVATTTETVTPVTETITDRTATVTETVSRTIATSTITQFVSVAATSTSTVNVPARTVKRDVEKRAVNPRASAQWTVILRQSPTYIASVCSCLPTPVTVLASITPVRTVSVTATSPSSVTATVTSSVTSTSTVSGATTTTSTTSITATTTETSTTTTTTVTATATQTVQMRGALCDAPGFGFGGGCDNCYCDRRWNSPYGVCKEQLNCDGATCSVDADCAAGQACSNDYCAGGGRCMAYTGCTSSYVLPPAKRDLEAIEKISSPVKRRSLVGDAKEVLQCRRKGFSFAQCWEQLHG